MEHGRMRDTMLPRDETSALYTPVARDATRHWYATAPVIPRGSG
jgi:CRISPR-associated endonuclease/helicase Cas3